jgi:hypothetical protein
MNKLQVATVASLLALAATTAGAVTFDATNTASNTPGGQRFDQAVGLDYAKQVLSDASTFIWNTFNQPSPADRKPVDAVTLVVEDIDGVAFTSANGIHLSAQYVGNYSGDVKTEVGEIRSSVLVVWPSCFETLEIRQVRGCLVREKFWETLLYQFCCYLTNIIQSWTN